MIKFISYDNLSKDDISMAYGGLYALMLDVKVGVVMFPTMEQYYAWNKEIPT